MARVEKNRNNGTLTEAGFRGMIRSALRKKAMYRKPIQAYKKSKQIPYVGENKRRKFSYICEDCLCEFDGKEVEVNHIIPAGSLRCAEDLPGFVERLFAEEGYTLLCKECHRKETAIQKSLNP